MADIKKRDNIYLFIIFAVGILARILFLSQMPYGLNQDEAYAGWEALNLLKYGIDSNGYSWPVYFVAWGSGMNVLYSYLSLPFIALFGVNAISVRIVQSVCGCIALFVFYRLLKIVKPNLALLGTFFLAINPWHIMASRWGLESNIAPFFILLGVWTALEYMEGRKVFILLSGLFFGLALYGYATSWMFVPLLLIAFLAYGLATKKISFKDKYIWGFVIILFILAFPLILFNLVQMDIIPEMQIGIISIPKLRQFRGGEVGNFAFGNFLNFIGQLLAQQDENVYNSIPMVGNHYMFLFMFLFIGIFFAIRDLFKSIKNKEYDPAAVMGIWFMISFIVCLTITGINTNKMNHIHFSLIYCTIYGLSLLFNLNNVSKKVVPVFLSALFIFFGMNYVKEMSNPNLLRFFGGYEECLVYADENYPEYDICIGGIKYPNVLATIDCSLPDFLENRVLETGPILCEDTIRVNHFYQRDYDDVAQEVERYDKYVFSFKLSEMPLENTVYMVPNYVVNEYCEKYPLTILHRDVSYSLLGSK